MRYRLGIDVGGTFTDLTLVSHEGQMHTLKVATRANDIAGGCLEGAQQLLSEAQVEPALIEYWSHGSTVATNAVVERKGARIALLTTKGFRDLLEIGRQVKPDRYNLHRLKPEPLVPRDRRIEVSERTLWDGSIHERLDEAELASILEVLTTFNVEAIAVCFLHSYANPTHERIVHARLQERMPNTYITTSHDVLPEFREYPRCASTVANAYIGPVVGRYLKRFDRGGREIGIEPPLSVFQSNGGITSASAASRLPLKVLYSGPAAGVRGAIHLAREAGLGDAVTFDMGGTSCDVCLIRDGSPLLTNERTLAGFPLRTPMIDVHSIGAGGGSIAWIDHGGLLHVGPQSAGADPGPACYGIGGVAPTVTDANLVLGRLNPSSLLNGRLKLHADRAHTTVAKLSAQLGLSPARVALGIVDVVNSNMIGAIRVVTVERGYDYRDFALIAFGGAGPLHAAEVAMEMGINRILIPTAPGLLCAMGLLLAEYRSDFTRTRVIAANPDAWSTLSEVFAELEQDAREWAQRHAIPTSGAKLERSVFMRYVGQSYQLSVPTDPIDSHAGIAGLVSAFHEAHRMHYGYARPGAPVETVDFRLTWVAPVPHASSPRSLPKRARTTLSEAKLDERAVWCKSSPEPIRTPVYSRELLPTDRVLRGPLLIEQMDSTTWVPPSVGMTVDEFGNIHISL